MTETMIEIGQRVRERRIALGLTQQALADRCGWQDKSDVSKIEGGRKKSVSNFAITSLCEALQVSPDYILNGCDKASNIDPSIPVIDFSRPEVTKQANEAISQAFYKVLERSPREVVFAHFHEIGRMALLPAEEGKREDK